MGFGDFRSICNQTAIPLCQVVSLSKNNTNDFLKEGIVPVCYARSIELANTVIFQIGNAFINIGAIFVILIILYNIRTKYTAIGRCEMLFFYNIILVLVVITLVVDCGVSPPGSGSYPYSVSLQLALASASCWCLMICGFLGFRIWEDGTVKSLAFLRITSLLMGLLTFIVSIITFNDWVNNDGIDRSTPTGLFIVTYLLNAIYLFIYLASQLTLAVFVIRNYWVLGAIALALVSFILGQVLMYAFSRAICEGVKHYIDGLFFGSVCNLFTLMMLYKFWDMTTDDDLEFSISINRDGDISYAEK